MSVGEQVAAPLARQSTRHESFLVYRRFRFAKLAALLGLLSLVLYIIDRPFGTRYGGSAAGYTLGTIGALLILWLTWFGYRKRRYAAGNERLVGQLSAHVYFGVVLLLIVTLHTGFHFGWNIHTLAYGLMCLVIASGAFGTYCYARYPRLMTENRASMTTRQMLQRIASIDEELRQVALPLDDATAALVERSVERVQIGGSVLRQLSGDYPDCATTAAIIAMDTAPSPRDPVQQEPRRHVRVLLDEKLALLAQVRRDISYKAIMDLWLYVHVPVTFALLAALLAHVVLVFFFW